MKLVIIFPQFLMLGRGLSATAKHVSNTIPGQTSEAIKSLGIFNHAIIVVVSCRDDGKIMRVLESLTNQRLQS